MRNNDINNTINPKKKVSYDDIKKIVEDEREPNYKVENNNIKNKSKQLLNKKSLKRSYILFAL